MYIVLRPESGEKSEKETQSSGSGKEGKFKKSAESEAQEEASETPKEYIETQQKCSEAPQKGSEARVDQDSAAPKKNKNGDEGREMESKDGHGGHRTEVCRMLGHYLSFSQDLFTIYPLDSLGLVSILQFVF